MSVNQYEMTCGIEIHLELNTEQKIFCSCKNSFGGYPNTRCCPTCIGMPGGIPRLNKSVIEKTIMAGLALNCRINTVSAFDRKNYFYPDLPKAYQLTQYYNPICRNGNLVLDDGNKIYIDRVHIEEDAGKIINNEDGLLIDYNRSGIPLIEIVSEPHIRTPVQARDYVEKIHRLMKYIGISDCKMQEGSMRCDVNVSVKRKGEKISGTLVEIKNLNSKRYVKKALEYEFDRQIKSLNNNEKIERETRRYNHLLNITEPLRVKELWCEYRHFRDPDTPIINVTNDDIRKAEKLMPEELDIKLEKYVESFGLSRQTALTILKYKSVTDFFDKAATEVRNKRILSNLIVEVILSGFKGENEKETFKVRVLPRDLCILTNSIENKLISNSEAIVLINKLISSECGIDEVLYDDKECINKEDVFEICSQVIEENQKTVSDYIKGKDKAADFLVGCAVKKTGNRINSGEYKKIIQNILKGI